MKRNFLSRTVPALLWILLCALPQHAEAQFFKKLFGRKKPAQAEAPAPKPDSVVARPRAGAGETISYPETELKPEYRVDVLLPIYVEEVTRGGIGIREHIPEKAQMGVGFFQGVQLACDTLRHQYRLRVYVHDIASRHESVDQLLQSGALDSSDLIIGAVSGAQTEPLSDLAQRKKINFISVSSAYDGGVTNNPYLTTLQPSLRVHCEYLVRAAQKHQPGRPLLVYHRSTVASDESAWGYMNSVGNAKMQSILCNAVPEKSYLDQQFSADDVNVILMPVLDVAFADSMLRQLASQFPSYRFEVYGMPSWKSFAALQKPGNFPNLVVYYSEPTYYDISEPWMYTLTNAYQHRFAGKPNEWTIKGYELMSWYAYLLTRYGTVFNTHQGERYHGQYTKYSIRPRWDNAHNLLHAENRHLFLYRYQGGSLMIDQ